MTSSQHSQRIDKQMKNCKAKAIKARNGKLRAYKNVANSANRLIKTIEENHFSITVLKAIGADK